MSMPRKRRRRRIPHTKGQSLINGLMKTLQKHDFDHQLSETAHHFGVSKQEVLTQILGR